ncbi:uncharacterized protein MELLADRAFT_104511 [Melampsora larici-populina 98AG31]|uniref:Alpha-type protein kinase domain-containing protein n=1 Tax=Melampsora larici-populina (strain 98AG31 / pathotype 3-4-7) TaxID=747676 RepID=F4REX9_MELLP|nr:uncharacterized protein MELLADRAFT_104511 [Melampsora larici-populina 98AG31]EGG09186.1 hypothetical protein MELLADRAFT_104511 [Melampsora larici-populina 98AG31]
MESPSPDSSPDVTGSDIDPSHMLASSEPHPMVIDNICTVSPDWLIKLRLMIVDIRLNISNQLQNAIENSNDSATAVPYYKDIPDLGLREEGTLYRLSPKAFHPNHPHYNGHEVVPFLHERVGYKVGQHNDDEHTALIDGSGWEWVSRKLYLHHREYHIAGIYHLKYQNRWADMNSQGRAHCFERAQSSRYVAMALEAFQKTLFRKGRSNVGSVNATHLQWYHIAKSLAVQPSYVVQGSGCVNDEEPRWKICERATKGFDLHRFVWADNYQNEPNQKEAWPMTDLIFAFIHYTYELSGDRTLIANLVCDESGKLSNLTCYDRYKIPYHSRHSHDMEDAVHTAFTRFVNQHVCNEICEHLGSVYLK